MFIRGFVNKFTISRINTSLGILRISGCWCHKNQDACKLEVSSIEMMGTDGWVSLNYASDSVMNIIAELTSTITTHLLAKSK
jgi:hypothetical protein